MTFQNPQKMRLEESETKERKIGLVYDREKIGQNIERTAWHKQIEKRARERKKGREKEWLEGAHTIMRETKRKEQKSLF